MSNRPQKRGLLLSSQHRKYLCVWRMGLKCCYHCWGSRVTAVRRREGGRDGAAFRRQLHFLEVHLISVSICASLPSKVTLMQHPDPLRLSSLEELVSSSLSSVVCWTFLITLRQNWLILTSKTKTFLIIVIEQYFFEARDKETEVKS